VVRGQVLHQNKGHPGIGVGGHAGEEGLEGRQPAGGGADADDVEPGPGGPGSARHLWSRDNASRYRLFRFSFFSGEAFLFSGKAGILFRLEAQDQKSEYAYSHSIRHGRKHQ